MQKNVDLQILEMNFLEFLTSFLEGRIKLPVILQVNERIYNRGYEALSPTLFAVATRLHELKSRIDLGEQIDNETIMNEINENVLALIDNQEKKKNYA